MSTLSRRGVLIGGLASALVAAGGRAGAAARPTITVHKSPT